MHWYNYVVFVIFLIMLVSPAWFFQKLEKILHEDYTGDDAMTVDAHVSSHNIIPQFDTEQSLSRDEKILNNLSFNHNSNKEYSFSHQSNLFLNILNDITNGRLSKSI